MRLVLDEHFSYIIAEELQKRGYDVVAAAERGGAPGEGLRGVPDEDLLNWAHANDRVMVTENARHFMPIHIAWLSAGEKHAGIILTSPRKFQRNPESFGAIIAALAAFIEEHRDRTIRGEITWL